MSTLRIVFAGTPGISAGVLEHLITNELKPIAVFSQPDRPKGRGRILTASPVKTLAQAHNIDVYTPLKFDTDAQDQLRALKPHLLIVIAYGLILPQTALDIPNVGAWNIHVSLLPRWRGAAPIVRAIEAGDQETGACIMQMEAGLDTGPILHQEALPILPADTAQTLHDRLMTLSQSTLIEAIKLQQSNQLLAQDQSEHGITYAHKLSKAEAWIDWSQDAVIIHNKIRAFNPWPVAQTALNGEVTRLYESHLQHEHLPKSYGKKPGTIVGLKHGVLFVATGSSPIAITQVQRPSKRIQSITDVVNSSPDLFQTGQIFEYDTRT